MVVLAIKFYNNQTTTTIAEAESTDTEHLCLLFKKPVSALNKQDNLPFTKQCPVCEIEYYNCVKCVKKYFNDYKSLILITLFINYMT